MILQRHIPKNPNLAALLAIAALSLLIYAPALNAPFIFDDYSNIVHNPDIKRVSNLPSRLFYAMPDIDPNRNLPTRPLVFFTLTVNYAIGGLSPAGYHLFSLLLHIGTAFLVFLIAQRLMGPDPGILPPLFAALLFAAHPIQTDAVSYASNRSDLLAAFFYLLAIRLFLKDRSAKTAAACALSFVLALASKEIAATLPIILLLADYFLLSGKNWRAVAQRKYLHLCLWAILIAFMAARAYYLGRIGFTGRNLEASWTALSYFRTQIFVVAQYVRLLIIPIGQSLDHWILPVMNGSDPRLLKAAAFWAATAAAGATFFLRYPARRLWLLPAAWFFVTLAPTSSFLPIFDAMVERRLYLPGVGLFIAAGFLLARAGQHAKTGLAAAFLFAALLGALTFQRNRLYADPALLWQESIRLYPENTRAYNNLGSVYFQRRLFPQAIEQMQKAIALDPAGIDYHSNLGSAYYESGDPRSAFLAYQKCVELNPNDAIAHFNLGNVFMNARDLGRAEMCYRKSIELNPRYAEPYGNLGVIYFEKGDLENARSHFAKSLELNPDYAIAENGMGKLAVRAGRQDEAAAYFQKALEGAPGFAEPYANLGDIYLSAGNPAEAEYHFRKSLELNPGLTAGFDGLGRVYYSQGKMQDALNCYLKVVEASPNNASAHHNLGAVFFQMNDQKKALECYRRAVSLQPDFAPAYNDIGIILMNQKKYAEAEKNFQISADMNPRFALAHENLGDLYAETRQNAKAVQSYERCIALDPGRSDITAKISCLKSPSRD